MNSEEGLKALTPPGVHEKVLELASALPGDEMLDVPAGYGALTEKLLAIGKKVTAADIDVEKFGLSRDLPNLHVVCLDLNDPLLPLPDNQFDAIFFIEGIEHLQSQWNAIRSLHRMTKPGGYLILTTPNILNIRSRIRYFMEGRYEYFKRPMVKGKSWAHDLENYHIAPVTYFELQFILESSGFEVQELHTNQYKGKNFLTKSVKPLFRVFYRHKNYRDRKRNRGEHRELYKTIMSDVLFFGETLIVIAKKV